MNRHFTLDRVECEKPMTAEEEAAATLERLQSLSYEAAVKMEKILKSSSTPDSAKIAVINMVMDRVYGRPEEMLRVKSFERSREESEERIRAYAEALVSEQ